MLNPKPYSSMCTRDCTYASQVFPHSDWIQSITICEQRPGKPCIITPYNTLYHLVIEPIDANNVYMSWTTTLLPMLFSRSICMCGGAWGRSAGFKEGVGAWVMVISISGLGLVSKPTARYCRKSLQTYCL